MDSFGMPMDAPDVGDQMSFFAVRRLGDPSTWQYHYGLQFESTARYGGEGRCGDGDDFIIDEGVLTLPERVIEDNDEEGYLYEFAIDNIPSIPDEVMEEYQNDADLCECSDMIERGAQYSSFEEMYCDLHGIDEPYEIERENARKLEKWGAANGWVWDFAGN